MDSPLGTIKTVVFIIGCASPQSAKSAFVCYITVQLVSKIPSVENSQYNKK